MDENLKNQTIMVFPAMPWYANTMIPASFYRLQPELFHTLWRIVKVPVGILPPQTCSAGTGLRNSQGASAAC